MVKLYDGGVYLVNGTEIVTDPAALPSLCGKSDTTEEAQKGAETCRTCACALTA